MLIDKIPYAIFSGIFLGIAALGKQRVIAHHSVWETALMAAKSTVWDYFKAWGEDGTWQKLVDALRGAVRTAEGRAETPSAGATLHG